MLKTTIGHTIALAILLLTGCSSESSEQALRRQYEMMLQMQGQKIHSLETALESINQEHSEAINAWEAVVEDQKAAIEEWRRLADRQLADINALTAERNQLQRELTDR